MGFRAGLAEESGDVSPCDVPGFADPAEQMRDSLARVRACGRPAHREDVRGFVVDVDTAKLTVVS